jgi:hypothetical protein
MIFELIRKADYEKLENYIFSNPLSHLELDEKKRSPIYLSFIENDYNALLVLLKKQEFVDLFNSPIMAFKNEVNTFEFQLGFSKYIEHKNLLQCLPFIKNINVQDGHGDTCFHYFCYRLESYMFSRSLLSSTMIKKEIVNQELIKTLEQFLHYGLDFNIKNIKNQKALDYIGEEYHDFFSPSIDFIKNASEKKYLETQCKDHLTLINKKTKL